MGNRRLCQVNSRLADRDMIGISEAHRANPDRMGAIGLHRSGVRGALVSAIPLDGGIEARGARAAACRPGRRGQMLGAYAVWGIRAISRAGLLTTFPHPARTWPLEWYAGIATLRWRRWRDLVNCPFMGLGSFCITVFCDAPRLAGADTRRPRPILFNCQRSGRGQRLI
jgi:hypothetical protein